MRRGAWLAGAGLVVLGAAGLAGHQAARSHVRTMMGGVDAPIGCVSCHAYMKRDALVRRFTEESYLSPRDLALDAAGRTLYVVAEDADAVLVVDLEAGGAVTGRIPVGRRPHSIVVAPDGRTAYVTNSWSDDVSVIDLAAAEEVASLPTGMEPAGLALDPAGRTLFVANRASDDISVIDVVEGCETKRLMAGNNPYAVRASPDGRRVFVTNRLTEGTGIREPARTEVTVLDVASGRVVERPRLESAHLSEGIAVLPDGGLALATVVRPNNLVPASQVAQGWMLTYGLAAIRPGSGVPPVQVLLDDVNGYYADPYDVVVTPDGGRAFVTHAAADIVTAIDVAALRRTLANARPDSVGVFANHLGLSRRFVLARIHTGANPKRMAVSPDGNRVYVAERLEDRVAVIDVRSLEVVDRIELGGPDRISTLRLGARQFHGARAFQGQFSCRTCHPDEDQDALGWDFAGNGMGRNVVNTMTLREIGATSPFKWTGTNTSLYMQDGIRFAKHLTRVDPFSTEDLRALVAYIYAIEAPPNRYHRSELTEAQRRGKALFERTERADGSPIPPEGRCITCHNGPYLTNRAKFDVGTRRDTDSPGAVFDTPQLVNLADTDPYLHDGSAPTLESIWTENSVNDEHGVVSDFNKNQLNDLVEYLRTLGAPER